MTGRQKFEAALSAAGSDQFLPDLELQAVSAPAYGLMEEQINLPFTIQSHLNREVSTTLELAGPRGVVARKPVVLPPLAQMQGALQLTPEDEGEQTFTVRLPVEPDETRADNNARSFRIVLRRELLRVLLIETKPRWEYRYLRNALLRDPGVRVSSPALTDKDREDARFAVGLGVDYIALSFVRSAADIELARRVVAEAGGDTPIIAKLEKPEAMAELAALGCVARPVASSY